jgi:GTP pyrophosphokinase
LIEVQWDETSQETFPVRICIRCIDRVGLLADVAASISKSGANIISAKTDTNENKAVNSYFTITVGNIDQLNRVLAGLKKVKHVKEVHRIG